MKDEYDFSTGKRGALLPTKGKTRITIYLDDAILEEFKSRAEASGTGYQTLINAALSNFISENMEKPLTESAFRRILREEFSQQYKTGNQ